MVKSSLMSVLALCFVLVSTPARAGSGTWPFEIEVQHRPGTYWWCPGSAWDEESIDWNLENLKAGGIGTVHIVPIYGAKGYESRYIPYLSEKWIESLQYILTKARALGLQVDMTTGTGWCFGGPGLAEDHRDTVARLDEQTGELKFIRRRMVKRAGPGGAGHMLNPYSIGAISSYIERFDKALSNGALRPRAQYHDSFEYSGNWCAELPGEFAKRRGYDLRDHLGALFGKDDDAETARRMKYDYRLTAAQLHQEFIQTWAEWARSRDMLTRDQAHGSPANLLDVYATADIPETEMFGSPEFPIPRFRHEERFCREGDSDPRICRMASSAAHVAHKPGRQLVSAESCTWMREHWHGTLGQIKLEMDLFFLAGINHVFYHGSCYSAKDAPWPGWFFYASTKADWRNSIWRDMPFLNEYIARCQAVLQAGEPANDILLYWPIHDLWMDPAGLLKNLTVHHKEWIDTQRIGEVANLLDQAGYAFDFVSDDMLNDVRYDCGALTAPGGTYKVIVVPECRFMPSATLKRLADLAAQGAKIVFERALPSDVPGCADLAQRRAAFERAKRRLAQAVIAPDAPAGLRQLDIPRETLVDQGLRYIRRRTAGSHWYFVANHTARPVADWMELAVPFVSAVRHDPMTGASALLPTRETRSQRQLHLEIAPGQTFVIQASMSRLKAKPYVSLEETEDVLTLEGKWDVEFIEGGPDLPRRFHAISLASWTEAPDKRAQVFAGTARYTLTFPFSGIAGADDYVLDLGDVRESARVKINGEKVGTLFALPMSVSVGSFLKEGANTIEIEVTNLAANRIRDLDVRKVDWKIMHDINIVTPAYKAFDATQWPLQPSGLLGPVTLRAMRRK